MTKIQETQLSAEELNLFHSKHEIASSTTEETEEKNNLVLLHLALLEITRTLDKCLELAMKEETDDNVKVKKAFDNLKNHHYQNSYASSVQTAFGIAQVGMTAAGFDANLSTAVGALGQAGTGSFKDYNQGKIQAADALEIATAKKASENRAEQIKQIRNLEERARDSSTAAMNRAINAYEIRG